MSSLGSKIVTSSFSRSAKSFFRDGRLLSDLDDETVDCWLDDIRDRISSLARDRDVSPRDFAATLVGGIFGADSAVVVHVGDGSCVYRRSRSLDWEVASWPTQGEYAATTFFVTDDPAPRICLSRIEAAISEVALFTDGIERLALDFLNKSAYAPFFNSMFGSLPTNSAGRSRGLSRSLRAFLDSEAVTERTDDDKTLIMARRAVRS